TVEYLNAQGEKVGLVKVRLYRPFSREHLLKALPNTVKKIGVLDRTKEPGGAGEPLYIDVVASLAEAAALGESEFDSTPRVVGGRYGLSSKEFTPAMVKAVFDELAKESPKNSFTVGIIDDVTHTSLDFDPEFDIEPDDVVRGVFWGLGADGTVGANKNSIKIIGEETPNYAQGHFVYDSKKSGALTVSHLRFGPHPIHSTYQIHKANFVAVHQFGFFQKYDVLEPAMKGATLLINAPYPADEVWDQLPHSVQQGIIDKQLKVYTIDAYEVAGGLGLGTRINTIMQTCFFAISGVLPQDEAIEKIKEAIQKTYGKRGERVVKMNFAAVDAAVSHMHRIEVPSEATSTIEMPPTVPEEAPKFVKNVTAMMMSGEGDLLPVSSLPIDGTFPTGTTKWEKRGITLEVPVWEPELCIQCGKCAMVCPHAVIRTALVDESELEGAPEGFKTSSSRFREFPDKKYSLIVSTEDCTGCTLCVEVCPVKDKSNVGRKAINMASLLPIREEAKEQWAFFTTLPEQPHVDTLKFTNVKNIQLLQPLFEFNGACAGCGETPYVKLMTQLFGDRALIANATGCSSIYGGNLPTTPYTVNSEGRGPTWSNSLFEDNAEFGMGMRLTLDRQHTYARELVGRLHATIGGELVAALLSTDQSNDEGIAAQRANVEKLKATLEGNDDPAAKDLYSLADKLVKKSVWIVGGDGWAYDIGYGGLDHVLASGRNVNVLVLDTEVYSNTGGQSSKATPLAAVAKFAAGGKGNQSKDLGMMAITYGNVYVAQVALGANDRQVVNAFLEAESYDGPSLIIAYSHCIAHGINMAKGLEQQQLATDTGYWPLYRFDPRLKEQGKNPFQLDSKAPKIPLEQYAYNENRYRMLTQIDPQRAELLMAKAQDAVNERWQKYEELASRTATA
ncbi:MAG: pyruvate:ferredoxin (flavodoxin) oxidoreductase, partial [Caldilineaceae bacterium]